MPDLGEGLEEGRIVRWPVVEIPSPFAGRIQVLHGSDGEDMPVGAPLVTFEATGGAVAYLDMVSVDQPPSGPVPATPPVRKLAQELGVAIDHPLINARWSPDAILAANTVNAGLAIDTERGLIVAVVRDAQTLGIAQIAAESSRLAEGARAGSLTANDLSGATIAVSNTGSYGSEAGTPILSPGTSVTLAIGVIADRALVIDGRVVARPAATLSLTFDHRVLDGAAAGRALTELVDLLQSDERLRDLPR